METRTVTLRGEFVELNKLLKFENLVASGGEAKMAITGGAVVVDGDVETRIRRKLFAGSVVKVGDVEIQIEGNAE